MENLMNHTINQNSSPFLKDESGKVVAFNPNACNLCNGSVDYREGFQLGLVQILNRQIGKTTIEKGQVFTSIGIGDNDSILLTLNLIFNHKNENNYRPLADPIDVCKKCSFYNPKDPLACNGAKYIEADHDVGVIVVEIKP